jgi:hypothetical protein
MKITISQLKELISEQIKLVSARPLTQKEIEQDRPDYSSNDKFTNLITDLVYKCLNRPFKERDPEIIKSVINLLNPRFKQYHIQFDPNKITKHTIDKWIDMLNEVPDKTGEPAGDENNDPVICKKYFQKWLK